jgi:hypothetical protein
MKTYGEVDVRIHVFLISGHLISGERPPGTHWTGGRVCPRTGLEDTEK